MHLNVPPPGESIFRSWMRNIKWALLGIFGPEMVVFLAWQQYLSAKTLVQKSKNELNVKETLLQGEMVERQPETEPAEHPSTHRDSPCHWTIVHGFYAGMGGFTFPLNNVTTNLMSPSFQFNCKRLTLTARGVALLAGCNLLPNIETESLNDKSKSDGLSKFIACVQAAWLIVQVIGRIRLGLQVTLLEINTLGHVLCALIMYVLWWHKPRMVLQPIVLDGDWVGPLCAYMYMSSRISGQDSEPRGLLTNPVVDPEMTSVAFFSDTPCKHPVASVKECHDVNARQISDDDISSIGQDQGPRPALIAGSHASGFARVRGESTIDGSFGPRPASPSFDKRSYNDAGRIECSEESQGPGAGRQLRWRLAAQAVSRYPAIKRRFTRITDGSKGQLTKCLQEIEPEELLEEHCGNWSTKGLLQGDDSLVMGMAVWFASMAFGGIHVAAWNEYFPSKVEAWLWQCSAIYILWCGLFWLLINLLARISKPFDDYWNSVRSHQAPFVKSTLLAIVFFFCGCLYAFARMYLVMEAFISIRKLPVSAYQTPDWTQAIPHL